MLDRGHKLFKQTAPIIKLPEGAAENDHLALLAYLNSSTACFWMKQVFMNKGGSGVGRGIQDEAWEARYEFDGTKLAATPLFRSDRLLEFARRADVLAKQRAQIGASRVLAAGGVTSLSELRARLSSEYDREQRLHEQLVAVQEDIDREVYVCVGLYEGTLTESHAMCAGTRAFEHALARNNPSTQWFVRNGYADPKAMSEVPKDIAQRVRAIENSPELRLIEQPEYKRRWTMRDPDAEISMAARDHLLSAAERQLGTLVVVTGRDLVRTLFEEGYNRAVAELLGDPEASVADLVAEDALPFLAAARFTEVGLATHSRWLFTWDAQRRQDAGESLEIEVPPRYSKSDFATDRYWQLRGKLDVPTERFISYPHCESDTDGEPVYGWAGWNHLQRAQALATLYLDRRDNEGWPADRLTPMLAGLLELLPWVKQWHNEVTPDSDVPMGDFYESFLAEECRRHNLTHDDLRAWRPPKKTRAKPKAKTTNGEPEPKKPRKRKAEPAAEVDSTE